MQTGGLQIIVKLGVELENVGLAPSVVLLMFSTAAVYCRRLLDTADVKMISRLGECLSSHRKTTTWSLANSLPTCDSVFI